MRRDSTSKEFGFGLAEFPNEKERPQITHKKFNHILKRHRKIIRMKNIFGFNETKITWYSNNTFYKEYFWTSKF